MFLYNRLDRFLGFALIDRAVLSLAETYGFKRQHHYDIGFLRLALFSILGDFQVFHKETGNSSEFIFPPTNLLNGYSPLCQYRADIGYPHPITILATLRRLMGSRKLPNLPMIFENEWSEAKRPLESPNMEFKAQKYQNIPFPHNCTECYSYDHQKEHCDGTELLLAGCIYPLCNEDDHTILNCPVIISRCTICKEVGHMDHHHQERNFDILKGWVTRHAYSNLHRFAGIMNSKEALSEVLRTL